MKTDKFFARTIIIALVSVAVLTGCGPSGGGGDPTDPDSADKLNPNDINLSQDIADGKIVDYRSSDPAKIKYLVIINYLRSLPIKCNDPDARTGPVSPKMEWNDDLADAAREHSEDMRISGHYSHDGSGTASDTTGQSFTPARPSTFEERILKNGYSGSLHAENIAYSQASYVLPDDYWITIMEGWMASEHGHCSNIMHPSLKDFGMHESRASKDASGYYYIYWTQDFGG